jgi:hypothetical protein
MYEYIFKHLDDLSRHYSAFELRVANDIHASIARGDVLEVMRSPPDRLAGYGMKLNICHANVLCCLLDFPDCSMVTGWVLGEYIASLHSVIRDPNGNLCCITPHPNDRLMFLPDPEIKVRVSLDLIKLIKYGQALPGTVRLKPELVRRDAKQYKKQILATGKLPLPLTHCKTILPPFLQSLPVSFLTRLHRTRPAALAACSPSAYGLGYEAMRL